MLVLMIISECVMAQTLEDAMMINTSGILAQRFKMTIIAENVANLMTL